MDFELSPKTERLKAKLQEFMEREIYPAEAVFERQLAAKAIVVSARAFMTAAK